MIEKLLVVLLLSIWARALLKILEQSQRKELSRAPRRKTITGPRSSHRCNYEITLQVQLKIPGLTS